MTENLSYIESHFLEWAEVCKRAGISSQALAQLIADQAIPKPSYTVAIHVEISSPLPDSALEKRTKKYFPKSIVELIEEARADARSAREKFKSTLYEKLNNNADKSYAYTDLLDSNGAIDPLRFEAYFEEKWAYYIDGVYGICTRHMRPDEIVRKGIAVNKLTEFDAAHQGRPVDAVQRARLQAIDAAYNEVATDFAPYQRHKSSRGKLDETLKKYGLVDLIKTGTE
ncbi:MAG: DUF6058 family natural product biosynthesis protein [Flavobacteriales bacterium]